MPWPWIHFPLANLSWVNHPSYCPSSLSWFISFSFQEFFPIITQHTIISPILKQLSHHLSSGFTALLLIGAYNHHHLQFFFSHSHMRLYQVVPELHQNSCCQGASVLPNPSLFLVLSNSPKHNEPFLLENVFTWLPGHHYALFVVLSAYISSQSPLLCLYLLQALKLLPRFNLHIFSLPNTFPPRMIQFSHGF